MPLGDLRRRQLVVEDTRRRRAGLHCFLIWVALCALFGAYLFFGAGAEGATNSAQRLVAASISSTNLFNAAGTVGKVSPGALHAGAEPPAAPAASAAAESAASAAASASAGAAPPPACPPPPVLLPPAALPVWPAPWPSNAVLRSTSGSPYRHLSLDALWAWSPERATIVSGDSFRDRCPFVCDDDYGVGKVRGCRFSADQLTDGARVFAKLPHHFPPARQLLQQAGVRHVFVNGGGDTPLEGAEIQAMHADPKLRGFFSINIPRSTPLDARLVGVPLGVERTISPRGQFPGMYLNQKTGYNLAAKLCWAPVLALAVANASGWPAGAPPLLYMNFRTETNPGVRDPARAAFTGKPWATDHVNAGDAIDLQLPGGGVREGHMEAYVRQLWERAGVVTDAPWFRTLCGAGPVVPRGIDPALVPELSLPGYPHFLKSMATVPFVLAPEGNGLSTHRAWEVMYVGTLAVIKEVNAMMDGQYRGMPVMMVRDWDEVTPEALTCYAVELFAKAAGVPAGGAGADGGGLYPPTGARGEADAFAVSAPAVAEALDRLDPSRALSTACAAPIARYAAAHPNTHTGFLSLEALDYEWWEDFITQHAVRMMG